MAKQTFTTGQVLTASQMQSLQATAMGGGSTTAKTASYVLVAADAGTTVAMNAAGTTTITVNTALFAAGDRVFIQNLGAGVCTVTAGTATVATSGSLVLEQNQGGELNFTSTSAAIFFQYATPAAGDITAVTAGTGISGGGSSGAVTITNSMATTIDAKGDLIVGTGADAFTRLAVGTNTHILTADSAEATGMKWAAAAGGGSGLTLIQRTSFSNVANTSTTFDGVFTSTYKFYQVVFEALHGVTADNDPILELLYSGTVQSAAYVGGAGASTYNTNTFSNVQNSGTNEYTFGTHIGNSTSVSTGIMWFSKVGNASERANINGLWFEPNDGKNRFLGVTVEQDRTYTGFRLKSSSTNITGTVAIYGLATS